MTARTLKIALAVSVALNVFAVAAAGTLYVNRAQVERRVADEHRPPRDGSPMRLIDRLSEPARPGVRAALRASALAARPDFEESRARRREAIALAVAPDYDADRVSALLDQSRAAEQRGRARLEAGAVELLGTVSAEDRVILADILKKRGHRSDRDKSRATPRPAGHENK